MLGTVRPTTIRTKTTIWLTVVVPLFAVASVSGAMLVGAGVWSAGTGLRWIFAGNLPLVVALVLVAVVYGASEVGLVHIPYVQRKSQVPPTWWGRRRVTIAVALYGFVLGTGISTPVLSALLYVVILGVMINPGLPYAAFVFGLFGLARAASVIFGSWHVRRHETGDEFVSILSQLSILQGLLRRVSGMSLIFVAGFFAAIMARSSLLR